MLKSLTTFVGGGGPRFWFSVAPEQRQPNYAQVIIEVADKHDTSHLVSEIQTALNAAIPGVRLDVRQLETGPPVGIPVSIRLSGEDIPTLRRLSAELAGILRAAPGAVRVRDNWGPESFAVRLQTDSDKANMSGLTNYDVAAASASAMSGVRVSVLREGDEQIPVVARLRMDERAQLSDMRSLYVYAGEGIAEGAAAIDLVGRLRDADREAAAPEPVPHHHGIGVSRHRVPAVGSARGGDAEARASSSRRCPRATAWRSAASTRSRSRASAISPS